MKTIKKLMLLLFTLMLSGVIYNVNAQVMTAKDFKEAYDEYYEGSGFKSYNLEVDGNILKIYSARSNELLKEVDCSLGYIEYDKTKADTEDENTPFIIEFLLNEIISIKLGYDQKENFTTSSNTSSNFYLPLYLDTSSYGDNNTYINMTAEEIEEHYEKYGRFAKCQLINNDQLDCDYIKLSFDTDKKDYFYQNLPILDNTPEQLKQALMLIPEVGVENIKKDSVSIFPQNTKEELTEGKNYCYVYRSTKKDSGYTRINNNKIRCNGEYAIIDDTLKPDTTYYYKARLEYTNQYSDPIEVTTLKGKTTTQKANTDEKTTTTQVPDNPKTGVSSHIFAIVLVSILGIVSIIILKKKSKLFSQI